MAAHRELWHKGLQRRALLTRKLGLGAIVTQRVPDVHGGEGPHRQGNLLALEPTRVAGAVQRR